MNTKDPIWQSGKCVHESGFWYYVDRKTRERTFVGSDFSIRDLSELERSTEKQLETAGLVRFN